MCQILEFQRNVCLDFVTLDAGFGDEKRGKRHLLYCCVNLELNVIATTVRFASCLK